MIHTDNVFVYGFSQSEEQYIQKMLPTQESYITPTDCMTDILAINSYAIFINVNATSEHDLQLLWSCYSEVSPTSETVVLVGNTVVPKALQNEIKVYTNFEELQQEIKYILLAARRKQNKTETFSNTLAIAIRILSEIHLHPGITSSQLAKKLEVSQRTVQRYIETLRVAGEWIEYDAKTKGLSFTDGKSVLWGEW